MIRSHTRIIVQQRRPRFSRLSYCPLLARTLALDLRITHARTLTLSAWHASWVWCARPPGTSLAAGTDPNIRPPHPHGNTERARNQNQRVRKPNRAQLPITPPRPPRSRPFWNARASTRPDSRILSHARRGYALSNAHRYLRAWIRLWVSVGRPLAPALCLSGVSTNNDVNSLVDAVSPVLPGTAPRPYLYCPTCLGPTYVNPRLCPTQRYVLRTIMH